ncbi:MAG: hypothetical protein E5X26_08455, partial [Mesorhizobium sp.]
SVLYVRVPRLFEDLALARLDGRFPRLIDKLTRAQLLILDDFGTHSLTEPVSDQVNARARELRCRELKLTL